jgi:hypothetical protein
MLANGEWVLNPNQVQRIGPENLKRFSSGGPVGAVGGSPAQHQAQSEGPDLAKQIAKMDSSFSSFAKYVGTFSQAIASFNGMASVLVKALNEMPREIKATGHQQLSVTFSGGGGGDLSNGSKQQITEAFIRSVAKQEVFDYHQLNHSENLMRDF